MRDSLKVSSSDSRGVGFKKEKGGIGKTGSIIERKYERIGKNFGSGSGSEPHWFGGEGDQA